MLYVLFVFLIFLYVIKNYYLCIYVHIRERGISIALAQFFQDVLLNFQWKKMTPVSIKGQLTNVAMARMGTFNYQKGTMVHKTKMSKVKSLFNTGLIFWWQSHKHSSSMIANSNCTMLYKRQSIMVGLWPKMTLSVIKRAQL